VKISRKQFGWCLVGLGFVLVAILWDSVHWKPNPSLVGVKLDRAERNVDLLALRTCAVIVTNGTVGRVVVQARLERLTNGEWRTIPCSQPGPMYISALWVLEVGETKSMSLPMPPDGPSDVTYRIGVDYWLRESGARVWKENLRNVGYGLLQRRPPDSGFAIIGGRGNTPIDTAARHRVNTEAWISVQPKDVQNSAPPFWFQFDGEWPRDGDSHR
jgi:hypothetical protein